MILFSVLCSVCFCDEGNSFVSSTMPMMPRNEEMNGQARHNETVLQTTTWLVTETEKKTRFENNGDFWKRQEEDARPIIFSNSRDRSRAECI